MFSDHSNVWALLMEMAAPSLLQAAARVILPLVFFNTGITGHYFVPSALKMQTFNF